MVERAKKVWVERSQVSRAPFSFSIFFSPRTMSRNPSPFASSALKRLVSLVFCPSVRFLLAMVIGRT